MWQRIDSDSPGKLKNAAMIVSVSTSIPQYQPLYSQGRILAEYLVKKLKFERIASLYSSALPPEVLTKDDGTVALPACHFYLHRGARDLVLFAGDSSPYDDQFGFANTVLDFALKLGVKDVYSVGVRWSETPLSPSDVPSVVGFATTAEGAKKLKASGVELISNEPAPFFASIVVAAAATHGMDGYKISVNHGEPSPHNKAVAKMLEVLSGMIGFHIDIAELQVPAAAPPAPPRVDTSGIYH